VGTEDRVIAPCRHEFPSLDLLREPGGRAFLNLVERPREFQREARRSVPSRTCLATHRARPAGRWFAGEHLVLDDSGCRRVTETRTRSARLLVQEIRSWNAAKFCQLLTPSITVIGPRQNAG